MPDAKKGRRILFPEDRKVAVIDEEVAEPGDEQVLVRMKACGICKYDIKCYLHNETNIEYSRQPGHEGVGTVEAVGCNVSDLKTGDNITSIYFGRAMADYFIADRNSVVKIPDTLVDYGAWVAEPVACAVNALRQVRLEPGDSVAVIGAGYMGLLLIQGLPKEFIERLIVIDIDKNRLELAKSFGADVVIDASRDGPVAAGTRKFNGCLDLVIEATGAQETIRQATEMLRNGGRLCLFGHHAADETVPTNDWHMKGISVLNTTPFSSMNFYKDLQDAVTLMKKGVFDQQNLINRSYYFDEMEKAMEELSDGQNDVIKAVLRNLSG